jgi:hypothetical protein
MATMMALPAVGQTEEAHTVIDRIQTAYAEGSITIDEKAINLFYLVTDPSQVDPRFKDPETVLRKDCATPILDEIFLNWEELSVATQALLAPLKYRPDNSSSEWYWGAGVDITVLSNTHFKVHYLDDSDAANSGNDHACSAAYAQGILDAAAVAWDHEVNTLGYHQPLVDADYASDYGSDPDLWGGDGRVDIYIYDGDWSGATVGEINPSGGYWVGFFMVALGVYDDGHPTTSHEFFHLIQYYYDRSQGSFWKEATCTWMQDDVFHDINDRVVQRVNNFLHDPQIPLDDTSGSHEYYACLWPIFLESHQGIDIMKEIWIDASERSSNGIVGDDTYDATERILNNYGDDLRSAFEVFITKNYNQSIYPDGVDYNTVYIEQSFTLSPTVRTTNEITVFIDHMASRYAKMVPDAALADETLLVVEARDMASIDKRAVIIVKDGSTYTEYQAGGGPVTIADFGTVDEVVLALGNASTTDDNTEFRFEAWINEPPVVICQDIFREADENCEATATAADFDGGTYDPDGDAFTLDISPAGPFPLGDTVVTLTATDSNGISDSCTALITVIDLTLPVVSCPADVTVECVTGGGVPADDPQLADFFAGFSATDNCDDELEVLNNAPSFFEGPCGSNGGITGVEWIAFDDAGNSATCMAAVRVIDTTAPEISVTVEPQVLWPPNHKMVEVVYTVTVSDICDPDPTWVLVDIVSDEPEDDNGDGNTEPDIQDADFGTPDNVVSLRAERDGRQDGRVYTATFAVTDCSGNSSQTTCDVFVPHSANDFAVFVSTGELPDPNDGCSFMVSGASIWGDLVPAEMSGGPGAGGEMNFVEPVSAFITNTAGYVVPEAFYLKDVDFDNHKDVLVGFDPVAVADLVAISAIEDGDPALVLEISEGNFIVLDLTKAEETDLDLAGMIGDLRIQGAPSEELVLSDTRAETVREAGLIGAAPNPFNPSTKISYYIPDSRHVELAIFDISGRRVARLVSQTMSAGEHSVMWNGQDTAGNRVASGVYFYRLTAGRLVETKRMIMVK